MDLNPTADKCIYLDPSQFQWNQVHPDPTPNPVTNELKIDARNQSNDLMSQNL